MPYTTRWQFCLAALLSAAAACSRNPAPETTTPTAAGGEVAAPSPTPAATPAAGGAFAVDGNLAKQGEGVYKSKACSGCHTIGKGRSAGPDLKGVTQRREIDWLRKWLLETDEMLNSDPVAQAMLKEYNGVRMPNMRLTKDQAEALIHYMASAK